MLVAICCISNPEVAISVVAHPDVTDVGRDMVVRASLSPRDKTRFDVFGGDWNTIHELMDMAFHIPNARLVSKGVEYRVVEFADIVPVFAGSAFAPKAQAVA